MAKIWVLQHHPAESGIGKRDLDAASRLTDRAATRANPCFDLSRYHEKSFSPLLSVMI